MDNFALSINTDIKPTGRYFEVTLPSSEKFGSTGEALKFLSWGGVVLLLDGEEKTRTYALGDLKEIFATVDTGEPLPQYTFAPKNDEQLRLL